jgi:putative transposase
MPMRQRKGMAGHVFHVLNRGVRRQTLFSAPDEYRKFQHLMLDAQARTPLPLLTYCLMSTHFHFVVQPSSDEELPEFMRWLCGTHARRFNLASGTTGLGAVYQARYRALPVQTDAHFLRVCRYVERNPLRPDSSLALRIGDGPAWSATQGPGAHGSKMSTPRPRKATRSTREA